MKTKKKGNTLMITLVILMVLTFHLLSFFQLEIVYARHLQSIKDVDKIRILTNTTIAYIKYVQKNDILLSEYIEKENMIVKYTVDDMGDYFYIDVTLQDHSIITEFEFDLDKQKNYIRNFSYK